MSLFRSVWLYVVVVIALPLLLNAQSEYRYSYLPKTVYENQLFPLTIVGPDDAPQLKFDTSSLIQPIFKKPLLVKNGDEAFYTFYFKAGKVNVQIPRLFIDSNKTQISLNPQKIALSQLNPEKKFSCVLATKMNIKGQQVSNYDTKNHIVTLSLEAFEANLEDMSLKHVTEFGIENIKRNHAKVIAEFYAVLPRSQKELSFSYFNTVKHRFITLKVPIDVANASVTTQSDLNPKVDAFERLKRYALIAFSLFFIMMFMWKRDFFYLVLGVISIITLLTFYIPHKKICVKQGSPLYILPTTTSTIGTRIEEKLDSMLLGEHGIYKKIEYKKGIIGWIKNEDICDN